MAAVAVTVGPWLPREERPSSPGLRFVLRSPAGASSSDGRSPPHHSRPTLGPSPGLACHAGPYVYQYPPPWSPPSLSPCSLQLRKHLSAFPKKARDFSVCFGFQMFFFLEGFRANCVTPGS